jgi:hypothetical protein
MLHASCLHRHSQRVLQLASAAAGSARGLRAPALRAVHCQAGGGPAHVQQPQPLAATAQHQQQGGQRLQRRHQDHHQQHQCQGRRQAHVCAAVAAAAEPSTAAAAVAQEVRAAQPLSVECDGGHAQRCFGGASWRRPSRQYMRPPVHHSTHTHTRTRMRTQYEAVIGIETHVQLLTRTKAFCSCANQYGDEPNTNVCPVCMGHPVSEQWGSPVPACMAAPEACDRLSPP